MKNASSPLRFLDPTTAFVLGVLVLVVSTVAAYVWERSRQIPFESARWIERPDKRYQMFDDLKSKLNAMKSDPQAFTNSVKMLGAETNSVHGTSEQDWSHIRQTIDPISGGNIFATDRYVIFYFDNQGRYFGLNVGVE